MTRTKYTVTIRLDSYVAEPYWPALDDIINIQKKSGMNRAKSEGKRELALKSYLKQEGILDCEYAGLLEQAAQKWYTTGAGKIMVPRHHLAGCLVQTVGSVPAAIRGKFDRDSFRHHVRLTDFVTDKTGPDTTFDRYVRNENTNQRRRSVSEVIENADAVGTVEINSAFKVKDFENLLTFALSETGVGSCRKMGFGRGQVVKLVESN